MLVLAVSDEVDEGLWHDVTPVRGVELILACGDLPFEYLDHLTQHARRAPGLRGRQPRPDGLGLPARPQRSRDARRTPRRAPVAARRGERRRPRRRRGRPAARRPRRVPCATATARTSTPSASKAVAPPAWPRRPGGNISRRLAPSTSCWPMHRPAIGRRRRPRPPGLRRPHRAGRPAPAAAAPARSRPPVRWRATPTAGSAAPSSATSSAATSLAIETEGNHAS